MNRVRLEAYKIVYNVLKRNQFSNKLLEQGRNRMKKSGDDTDLLYTLVKGTLKMYKHLDYVISQFTDETKYSRTDLKIRIMLYLGLYQLRFLSGSPEYAVVNETVEATKTLFGSKIADFVNGVLRSYLRNSLIKYPVDPVKRISAEYSFSEEMVEKFIDIYGEEQTEYACLYYNEKPRLKIRVNTMATTAEKFISYFERREIKFDRVSVSKNFLETDSGDKALHDVAFLEGYFSIQDPAAGLVVELLDPKINMSIIDMFSAPGGKCTYMSELMQDTGEVISIEKIPNKCKLIKQNLERLKLHNVNVIAEDVFKYGPIAPAYNKVLLDVPCSGWGVMQKKAEIRWQNNHDLPQLIKLQEQALKTGARFVCPGGDLIYSTCTLNPEENEIQVENFLGKHPDFKLIPAETILDLDLTENGYLKTVPWKHNIDGAFAARLQRKA